MPIKRWFSVIGLSYTLSAPAYSQQPAASEAAPAAAPAKQPAALELDDPVEPLVPSKRRSEAEADRVTAKALFTAGRVAEQKQELKEALRLYERAYRYDPESFPALREIVPLALSQDRTAEGLRYALLAIEREQVDSTTLRRLAVALAEAGDEERALKLFERATTIKPDEKPTSADVVMWMQMGLYSFRAQKYEAAADYFGKVDKALKNPEEYGLDDALRRRLLGNGDATYQTFGEAYLEAGRLDDAAAAFERANVLFPSEGVLAYQRARIAEKRHDPALALDRLQVYFDKHLSSQGGGPYELLARLLQQTNQSQDLDARLEKLMNDDPKNTPLIFFQAKRCEQAKEWERAETLFQKLVELHKQRTPVEALQGLVTVYRNQRQMAELLNVLGHTVSRADSLSVLGSAVGELSADKDTMKALKEEARREQAAGELNYGRAMAMALLACDGKDYASADDFFAAAASADPRRKGNVLMVWGVNLLVADYVADAIKVLQRGVDEQALPADNPAFHFYLASALELAGRTDEALQQAREAAELRKDDPRFVGRVAWVQYHAKRYADAEASYQALLKKFDDNTQSAEVRDAMREARAALSNINVMQHRLPQAEEWLEQILDEFPDNTGAMNDLGYLWADENKHLDRALEMVRKAVKDDPKNVAYLDSLGWALFRLGRFSEAVVELKAACAGEKPDATVLDHLGDAAAKTGDLATAIDAWQRAVAGLEKDNDKEKADAVRKKLEAAKPAETK